MDSLARSARARLGVPSDRPVIASVGLIRAYKNIPHLIRMFRALEIDATLLIAGKVSPPSLEDEIRAAAGGDERIVLDLRFMPDQDLPIVLEASDLIVLPYTRIQNSGSAILAASADRPVLVPALGAMKELREQLGREWVRTFDGELSEDDLAEAIAWATRPGRPERADLSSLDWDAIAERTLAAYQEFRRSSRGWPASRSVSLTTHRGS